MVGMKVAPFSGTPRSKALRYINSGTNVKEARTLRPDLTEAEKARLEKYGSLTFKRSADARLDAVFLPEYPAGREICSAGSGYGRRERTARRARRVTMAAKPLTGRANQSYNAAQMY
jgi:hypothetical protein